tara:strand:+ start:9246 stop:9809 length:564 start_codon:yes stop_codon:yes gene_type:complete
MQKTTILLIKSFLVCFSLLVANYNHSSINSNNFAYYDSLYKVSSSYIKDNQLEKSIMILTEIISKQRSYQKEDDILIMNARYDLGQIYLSRLFNYDKAVIQFEYIFNNVYSGYETEASNLTMKSLSELKEKSLFMLGYTYHNHIGNFTIAQNYYSIFLSKFSNNDLSASVEYELELINKAIANFKNK